VISNDSLILSFFLSFLYNLDGDTVIPKVVEKILNTIEKNGFEAYIVGGFVRDMYLLRATNDIDIATNALPKDLVQLFGSPRRKIEYGSYHMIIDGYNIDITTYRQEIGYTDGKLLEVIYSNNLLMDALRRDFTMNAMYMNKNQEIIDIYHGKDDLDHKVLKMIGNPNVRFREDPIRILRAVRFATVYHLKFEKSLRKAIQSNKKYIENIPISKRRQELDRILLANGFPMLKKMGLLQVLGIKSSKIVYVEDLAGLWAQLETSENYIFEKELKNSQKKIDKLLKCGTMNMLNLYDYGYYYCRVVAAINHFSFSKLERMMKKLPIHNRKEIVLTVDEIANLSGLTGKDLGVLLRNLEVDIVTGKMKNNREEIEKYILERR